MPTITNLEDLEDLCARLQIVSLKDVRDVSSRLAPAKRNVEGLIRGLESRHLITPYQATALRAGEISALRLGPYKLLYQNAAGSFARVYRAASVLDGKLIGLKVLREKWAKDPHSVLLFKREGELGKRLKHKNIVPIFDVASEGDLHYFTMEFVEGGNFKDFMKIRQKFAPNEAAKYVLEMCLALEYALKQNVTHRDLKLSNVLLSTAGVAKLADFGLAGKDAGNSVLNFDVNRAVEYATLEKNTQAPEGDPRSDIYFLGAMLYEMVSGVAPYPSTPDADLRKVFARYRDVKPIRKVNPTVPGELAGIIEQMMNINPFDRYQSVGQVMADLRRFLGDDAPPVGGSSARVPAPARPKPAEVATAIFVEKSVSRQNALRDYFSKHNFRVLLLSDPQRAITRMKTEPPDALVLMGASLEEAELEKIYQSAIEACRRKGTALVLTLPDKLSSRFADLQETGKTTILRGQTTLREMRTAMCQLMGLPLVSAKDKEPAEG